MNDAPPVGPPGRRREAFTLIEVLVSLAIFAMAAVVLGATYVNVLNSYAAMARSHDADEDARFARTQLLAEPDLQKAQDGDQFDSTGGRHITWTATVEPTTIADLFTVTFRCEITDPALSEPKKITQILTLLRPTWSDPVERSKRLQEAKDRIAELPGRKK
ncbi:MAG: prepilin-type N-terminal cleavage/methylation domain-containing protein [Opitutaceae bacterium]|nr:prepilin-type N-terminal cleavage/methylation domain-containing protein [Opitutaceae bacterium]